MYHIYLDPLAKSTVCNTLLESTDSSACNSASSASTSGVQDKVLIYTIYLYL